MTQVNIIFKIPFWLGVAGEPKYSPDNPDRLEHLFRWHQLLVVCFQLKHEARSHGVDPITADTTPEWEIALFVEVVQDHNLHRIEPLHFHERLPAFEMLLDCYPTKHGKFIGDCETEAQSRRMVADP